MSEETKKVHYTGSSPIEIRVGNFQRSFLPDEVAEIDEPRFRMDLLDRDGFAASQLDVRSGNKPKAKKKKAAPRADQESGVGGQESLDEAETSPTEENADETDATGGVNDNG